MLKKIFKLLMLMFISSGIGGDVAAETLLRLPPMKNPPVIDGKINDDEWRGGSVQFGAISRKTGILARRVVYFYFGYDDNNLYFAQRGELPPKPMKIDSGDDAVLTVVPPGAKKPFMFSLRELKAPIGITKGHWESEIAIPLNKIGVEKIEYGKPWKLQMSRHWSRPDETGDWAGKEFAVFIPQKNIPAVGFTGLWRYNKPYRGISYSIGWTAYDGNGEIICSNEIVSTEVPVHFNRTFPLAAGKTTMMGYPRILTQEMRTFKSKLTDKQSGEIIFLRTFDWDTTKGLMWVDPDPPIVFEFGIYPTYGKGKGRLHCANAEKLKSLKQPVFTITDKSGREFYRVGVEAGSSEHHFKLPELPVNEYLFNVEFMDAQNKLQKISRNFAIRKLPWQNLNLGTERIIVPPFKPLTVKDNCEIHALQTGYRMGRNFFEQIYAQGKNLLSAPAMININDNALDFAPPVFKEISPDRVIAETTAKQNNLTVKVLREFDYDGMCKLTLNFTPEGTFSFKNMYLDIPLKNEYAKLFHSTGGTMRRNIHGFIGETPGRVWDSRKAYQPFNFPGGFRPYLWFGDIEKGVAWFAETRHNWATGTQTPALELIRTDAGVTMRINIIGGSGVKHTMPFQIVMGLQPTPVKPIPEAGRKLSGSSWPAWTPETSEPLVVPHWPMVGLRIEDPPLTPPNSDYSFLHFIQKGAGKNVEENTAAVEDYIRRNHLDRNCFSKWVHYGDDGEEELGRRMLQGTRNTKVISHWFLYSNPRSLCPSWAEYAMYADEWTLGPWRSGARLDQYAIDPDSNYSDFMLYYQRQGINAGVTSGIYYDNIYDTYVRDPDLTAGRLGISDNDATPYIPIFTMRELMKRSAVMLTQMNKFIYGRPALMIHMTDVNMVPINSFASINYDWEMNFGSDPYQKRFPEEYILTNSTGAQTGAIPMLITNVQKTGREEIETSLLSVSLAYGLLTHTYQGNPSEHYRKVQNLIRDFGYGDLTRTTVFPGWRPGNPIASDLDKVKITTVKHNDGRYLLLVGNLSSAAEPLLTLPGLFTALDAETGKELGKGDQLRLKLDRYGYQIIELRGE